MTSSTFDTPPRPNPHRGHPEHPFSVTDGPGVAGRTALGASRSTWWAGLVAIPALRTAESFWSGDAGGLVERLAAVRAHATVLRDGVEAQVALDDVVPGDVLVLRAGDVIAADARVLNSDALLLDESTLTGERFPVEKHPGELPASTGLSDRTNAVWCGTHVASGTGTAVIAAVGEDTEFGRVGTSITQAHVPTSLELGLRRFGFLLMRVTATLVIGIFVVNVILNRPVLESFLFSLAIAVGLTPQLLPTIVTVTLSHGARQMARQQRGDDPHRQGSLRIRLGTCATTSEERATLVERFEKLSSDGLRVLGVATHTFTSDAPSTLTPAHESSLTFRGILCFTDPPKPDAAPAIAALAALGVATKLITGDNRFAAAHITAAVGLDSSKILVGAQMNALSDDERRHRRQHVLDGCCRHRPAVPPAASPPDPAPQLPLRHPGMTIAADRVDPELVASPHGWDTRRLRNFMIAFGLISSVFDIMTFAVLRLVFDAGPELFRTGWSIESTATELAVMLVLRTRRRAWRSRPATVLIAASAAVAAITVALPFTGLARDLGLTRPSTGVLAALVEITLAYIAATEFAKRSQSKDLTAPRARS